MVTYTPAFDDIAVVLLHMGAIHARENETVNREECPWLYANYLVTRKLLRQTRRKEEKISQILVF